MASSVVGTTEVICNEIPLTSISLPRTRQTAGKMLDLSLGKLRDSRWCHVASSLDGPTKPGLT